MKRSKVRSVFLLFIFAIADASCIRSSLQGAIPQFIAFNDSNRILFFTGPVFTNGASGSFVLGQPDFNSNVVNNGGITVGLNGARGVHFDGQHFIVADTFNHRTLIWNSLPTTSQQPADLVLGQLALNVGNCNWNGVTSTSQCQPCAVVSTGSSLIVADCGNNRLLVWNTFPTQNNQAADISIGGISSRPSLAFGGGKLFVTDDGSRAQAWNSIPTQNNQAPDFVLGQPNSTSTTANNSPQGAGIVSAYSLGSFDNVACTNGTNLVIGDRSNNRVTIWTSLPFKTWQPANLVLGQPDFLSTAANNTPGSPGTVSSQALSGAHAVYCDSKSLYVMDYSNRRTLVWKSYPTANQQPADYVFGQPDFTTVQSGSISANSFINPSKLTSNSLFPGVFRFGGY